MSQKGAKKREFWPNKGNLCVEGIIHEAVKKVTEGLFINQLFQ